MSALLKRTSSWDSGVKIERSDVSPSHSLRVRRMSVVPDMSLPPIIEGSKTLIAPSSKSSSGETSPQAHESLTRRPSRRSSVATVSSLSSDSSVLSLEKGNSTTRRNSIQRRDSFQKNDPIRRRSSILHIIPNDRKASFRTIGSKVTSLLRAKNAFNRLKKKAIVTGDDEIDEEKASEIKELPKEPRFASTLSVEAQYAMMKGYEDVVYSCLCNSYPEYRPMLHRNRTPLSGIDVRDLSESDNKHGKTRHIEKTKGEGENKQEEKLDATDGPVATQQPLSSTPAPGEQGYYRPSLPQERSDLQIDVVDEVLKPLANITPRVDKYMARDHPRHGVLPKLVSKDNQLVMTYRYQSAMDILDNVRKHVGVHVLSPRVKDTPKLQPVKEFNCWSHVWNKEFVPKQGGTKT